MAKTKAVKKAARPATASTKASSAAKPARKVVKKKPVARPEARKKTAVKATARPAAKTAPARTRVQPKPVARPVASKPAPAPQAEADAARKKGVRKATLTTGIRDEEQARKLGRSRIPIDAPLDVVFQNDIQAREAFMFLGIHSIRELEHFTPDELVLRLTGPAKLTVGRIRKILAMNNRCLTGDENFALEFQELLSRPRE